MKNLIKKASTEQIEKLWQACYDITETCYAIEEVNSPLERLELRCKYELISQANMLHKLILLEENKRAREEQNNEVDEETTENENVEEEGAV